jgi:hypothetical protein
MKALYKTARICLFPDWQPRTRCAPGFDDLRIGPGFASDPLQQVEDEWFYLL